MQQLQDLDQSRLSVLREAAHDLRGNVGIVKNAAAALRSSGLPEDMRERSIGLLEKGVTSLVVLLNDLLDLFRLEAGRDERRVATFDVSEVLGELCASMQQLAADRGLSLESHGPPALHVEGDAVKTRRIAQNLLLNAIKYTEQGSVRVSW